MTKDEVITLLCEHFSEGLVITIVDAIAKDEREYCAKLVESSIYDWKIDATNPHEWDELAIDLSIAIVNRTKVQDAKT
jgi:hypothetical protein